MRIGAVSYLNTKPLVFRLAEIAPRHELIFDLPSRLADRLASRELDVGLIPSIEFFHRPEYTIVSDACIACQGPVRSVKLVSRVPIPNIRTLALDEGSRTSVALVQILLRERYGVAPELLPFPITARPESMAADALLIIGDRAMHPGAPAGFEQEIDLGEAWRQWTGLPFVFAMWVAARPKSPRQADELSELAALLSQARDLGVAHVEEIAAREHRAVGITRGDCLTYLRDHLHFYLHDREQAGLELFRRHAEQLGFAPSAGTKRGPGDAPNGIALAVAGANSA